MARLPVLFLLSMVIILSGCDRGPKQKKIDSTNDMLMEYIKEDILKNASGVGSQSGVGGSVMEDVYKTNVVVEETPTNQPVTDMTQKEIPTENQIVMKDDTVPTQIPVEKTKQNNVGKQDKVYPQENQIPVENTIVPQNKKQPGGDKPIVIPQKTPQKQVTPAKQAPATAVSAKGSYIKVGNDTIGQEVSPRVFIKITMAVFPQVKNAKFCEFQLYAVPVGKPLKRTGYFMLAIYKFIDVINGQAQLTRYWNGANISGQFLPPGSYNLYLYYKVKNAKGGLLYATGRYWGNSRDFYIRLY